MKKSLVALAVLAASGAAFAQSTVTLYGVADAWFGQTKNGVRAVKQTVLNSGGVNGSRWGLRGSEDLGGGLKANFQLEAGYNIDTGASGSSTSFFNRQAFVGLSGGFGAVTVGRQYTAFDALRGVTNNTYDTAITTTGTVFGRGAAADYTGRVDNSLAYTSPDFGGVSGAVVYGLGENKTTTVGASSNLSLHVKYAAGPLLVGYAHQNEKAQVLNTTSVATGTASTKFNLIAGSYDLGMAKLLGGFQTAKKGTVDDKEYQLGVEIPVGAANIALGYTSTDASTGAEATGYSIAGVYDLSKRTRLYAGYNSTKGETAAGVKDHSTSLLAVGVRHRF